MLYNSDLMFVYEVIPSESVENIKSSDMFNKRKDRDKTVHYEDYNIASNSGDENHDIVTLVSVIFYI
jgi:hypothetical protein